MPDDTPDDAPPPALITPLESGYIRIGIAAAIPAINWVIYAFNLDVKLHIQKVTTDQVYQAVMAAITVASVISIFVKRIKEGKDPKSTAPKIVLRKPVPVPDQLAAIVAAKPMDVGPPHMTDEELLALIQKRIKK